MSKLIPGEYRCIECGRAFRFPTADNAEVTRNLRPLAIPCKFCGEKSDFVLPLGPTFHVEQMDDAGEWVEVQRDLPWSFWKGKLTTEAQRTQR